MSAAVDPAWLARLHARLAQPPRRPRVALAVQAPGPAQDAVVGSVEPALLDALADLRAPDGGPLLQPGGGPHVLLRGDATVALAALAQALRERGLSGAWRNEALQVCDVQDRRCATVERGVVRVLGIATRAVHLVGVTDAGVAG